MNSKLKYSLIVLILIIIAVSLFFILNTPAEPNASLSKITITKEGEFSSEECSARNLEDKVNMLESRYCSACKSTLPTFKKVCSEKDISPQILDLSVSEDYEKANELGIQVAYTPTFIFGCKYYIGAKSEAQYNALLGEFKNEQN